MVDYHCDRRTALHRFWPDACDSRPFRLNRVDFDAISCRLELFKAGLACRQRPHGCRL